MLYFYALLPTRKTQKKSRCLHTLEQGETAPFAGTLFNPPATAQLITAHQYSLTECDLLVEYEVAKARSEMQLQLSVLQISYDSLNEKHTLLMDIKNNEINTYREMSLEQPNKNNHWWFAGGAYRGYRAFSWSVLCRNKYCTMTNPKARSRLRHKS